MYIDIYPCAKLAKVACTVTDLTHTELYWAGPSVWPVQTGVWPQCSADKALTSTHWHDIKTLAAFIKSICQASDILKNVLLRCSIYWQQLIRCSELSWLLWRVDVHKICHLEFPVANSAAVGGDTAKYTSFYHCLKKSVGQDIKQHCQHGLLHCKMVECNKAADVQGSTLECNILSQYVHLGSLFWRKVMNMLIKMQFESLKYIMTW